MFRKHLLLVNIGISVGLSGLGDFAQQKYEVKSWSPRRTFHMSVSFGLTSGVLCHFWYNFLDKIHPGRGIKIVIKKILVDQVIFSPINIVACLIVACLLKGKKQSDQIYPEVIHKGIFEFWRAFGAG